MDLRVVLLAGLIVVAYRSDHFCEGLRFFCVLVVAVDGPDPEGHKETSQICGSRRRFLAVFSVSFRPAIGLQSILPSCQRLQSILADLGYSPFLPEDAGDLLLLPESFPHPSMLQDTLQFSFMKGALSAHSPMLAQYSQL